MTKIPILTKNDGFTLVQALFVLIVLALLGSAMMRLSGIQSTTTVFAMQGARAYQAARSGVEWGVGRALASSSCNGSMTIEGFSVTTQCSFTDYIEDINNIRVYQIESTAVLGAYGTPGFISRTFRMKVAI